MAVAPPNAKKYVDELAYCMVNKADFNPLPELRPILEPYEKVLDRYQPKQGDDEQYQMEWRDEYRLRLKEGKNLVGWISELLDMVTSSPADQVGLTSKIHKMGLQDLYRMVHLPELVTGKTGATPKVSHETPHKVFYTKKVPPRFGGMQIFGFGPHPNEFHVDPDIGLIGDMKLMDKFLKLPSRDYASLEGRMSRFSDELNKHITPLYGSRFRQVLNSLRSICSEGEGLGVPPPKRKFSDVLSIDELEEAREWPQLFKLPAEVLALAALPKYGEKFDRKYFQLTEDYRNLYEAVQAAHQESSDTPEDWTKRDRLLYVLFDNVDDPVNNHVATPLLTRIAENLRAVDNAVGAASSKLRLEREEDIEVYWCRDKCLRSARSVEQLLKTQMEQYVEQPSVARRV